MMLMDFHLKKNTELYKHTRITILKQNKLLFFLSRYL